MWHFVECFTEVETHTIYWFISIRAICEVMEGSNPAHGEVYSIQLYVIDFVSDLRQVGGFIRVLLFPPSKKKLTTTI